MLDMIRIMMGMGVVFFLLVIGLIVLLGYSKYYLIKNVFPDEDAWKGFVPFLSDYVLTEKTYGNGWYFALVFIPYVGFIYPYVMNYHLAERLSQEKGTCVLTAIFAPIMYFIIPGKPETRYIGHRDLFTSNKNKTNNQGYNPPQQGYTQPQQGYIQQQPYTQPQQQYQQPYTQPTQDYTQQYQTPQQYQQPYTQPPQDYTQQYQQQPYNNQQ